MKENKPAEMSMNFSVDIVNLVKHLKAQHKPLYQIKSAEAELLSVRIYTKPITHNEKRILSPNLKSRSKKQAKPDIGLNFYIERII